jgi:MraZ protein
MVKGIFEMKMFLGEYNPNLTEGSRIALPKKHREQISGDNVVLSKGFEKCIFVYDSQDWALNAEKQVENMKGDMKVSDLQRYLYTSAVDASVDFQGRLVLPANLKSYAGITTKTAVIGVGDHIEVWDYDTWIEYSNKITEKLSA